MTASPITVAIIGFSGLIGKRHTTHVQQAINTTLAALVDPSPHAAELAASSYPGVPYFLSVKDLLASSSVRRPEAAIVATPNHTHVPVATELVTAGIHVLVEKPISDNVEAAANLVSLAEENGVRLLVGHHRRFNPYVAAAKVAIASGALGDITAVSGLWTACKPRPYFDAPGLEWRSNKASGGGVVLINFVHEADVLQYLLGPITRIHAERSTARRSRAADAVEEGAVLTLRFATGVVGTFVLCDNVASPHFFEAGTGENPMLPRVLRADGDPIDVYRVFGTEGTLSVPDMTLWTYGAEERDWTSQLVVEKIPLDDDPRVPFERQLDHLVAVVRGEQVPLCSGQEGLRALRVCQAIRAALESDTGTVDVTLQQSQTI